jgi:hypothetical protein
MQLIITNNISAGRRKVFEIWQVNVNRNGHNIKHSKEVGSILVI